MIVFDVRFWAACIAVAALLGCSSPSQGANETVSSGPNRVLADDQYLAALRGEFVEVSGKDFVEFAKGSAVLSPAAEFRLERQALWLRAYPLISVRLVASGDGLERVSDRRLAMSRATAVQKHLVLVGVGEHQISGIDVEPAQSGNRQRVLTEIDLIQSAKDE
jgi:outer membrane protein OmpA-like peptidoglycan-associated protein